MSRKYETITIVLFLILAYTSSVFASLIVNTNKGKVRGFESKSVLNDTKYYSFLGIPYAKPPTGDLRFRPPVPAENWEGILNAEKEGNICVQSSLIFYNQSLIGDEDCLYLNVYTPQPPSEIKVRKAVMVWIHGGGFFFGSASSEGSPDYLMNYDIILVTLNYRLHALGFLNLGIRNASGNYGLKDQSLALKWVQENIGEFGGDPKNVTIFGESAGGASVHFQTISPLSKGLFQKAIAQSGYAQSRWALNTKPIECGLLLAKVLGFEQNNAEEVVEFLRKQPVNKIRYAVNKMQQSRKNLNFVDFGPSVEIIKENAFLPDTPKNLLKTAEIIPMIIGFVEHEGLLAFLDTNQSEIEDRLTLAVKFHFNNINDLCLNDIVSKVRKYYFESAKQFEDITLAFLNMWNDLSTLRLYETIEKLSDSPSPPYVYEFVYDGDMQNGKHFFAARNLSISGPIHADELPYLFYKPAAINNFKEIKPSDFKVIRHMCSLWTNFAKTGDPTYDMDVKWKPSTNSKPTYLEISLDLKQVESKIHERGNSFWTELFQFENNYPFKNSK